MSHESLPFGDKNIQCIQALAWCVMYLTLWCKYIDINSFNGDTMSGPIEYS